MSCRCPVLRSRTRRECDRSCSPQRDSTTGAVLCAYPSKVIAAGLPGLYHGSRLTTFWRASFPSHTACSSLLSVPYRSVAFQAFADGLSMAPSLYRHPTGANYFTVDLTVLQAMTQELADLFRLTLPIPFKKQAHTRSQSEQSSRHGRQFGGPDGLAECCGFPWQAVHPGDLDHGLCRARRRHGLPRTRWCRGIPDAPECA